jgi:hypothetical protein
MKRTLTVILSLAALSGAAAPLSAADCAGGYVKCLNDSADYWAPLRLVADFACFDDYTMCVYWKMLKS